MSYQTFIADAAREQLAQLATSRRRRVIERIDRLVVGDFASSQDLPAANTDMCLKRAHISRALHVVYAVDQAKKLVAVVRIESAAPAPRRTSGR